MPNCLNNCSWCEWETHFFLTSVGKLLIINFGSFFFLNSFCRKLCTAHYNQQKCVGLLCPAITASDAPQRLIDSSHRLNMHSPWLHDLCISTLKNIRTTLIMCINLPYFACLIHLLACLPLKAPLLWVMKGSYFGFGSPQQQVDMHARSKNTLIFL